MDSYLKVITYVFGRFFHQMNILYPDNFKSLAIVAWKNSKIFENIIRLKLLNNSEDLLDDKSVIADEIPQKRPKYSDLVSFRTSKNF